jgi:dipeptidyl aminopeptidase/acylaminoacyl peptidase
MQLRSFCAALVGLSCIAAIHSHLAHAQQAAPAKAPASSTKSVLKTEDFFRHPEFRGVVLSPDGLSLAATTSLRGRMALVSMELKTRKAIILTNFADNDVVEFYWVNNTRLVFSLGNINEPSGSDRRQGGGLFAIDRDGTDSRVLSPTVKEAIARGNAVYRFMAYVGRTPELSDEIYAMSNDRVASAPDVYRVNTRNGRKTLLSFRNPGEVQGWVPDMKGNIRAAISGNDQNKTTTWWRPDADADWQKMGEFALFEKNTLPLGIGYDDTFYVISNEGRDKYAIFTYDVAKRAVKDLVFEHPDVDVGVSDEGVGPDMSKLIFDHKAKKLVGIRYEADKPGVKWFDKDWAAQQKAIDAAVPDRVNMLYPPQYSDRVVVYSYSDRDAGSWMLYDRTAKTIESLVSSREWLKPADMVEMKPLRYPARDGLVIPSYLFVPKNSDGKKLPLLVNIHGGPMVRADKWHLDMWGPMESQFFANNGYAVLLPNFRGTMGFGHKHMVSSLRNWATTMQEDIEDGVDYLVKQGIVDPNRVCLYGASYGGYATLMGLAKTPDKYKCGVAALVVSDLILQLTSNKTDFGSSKAALNYWYRMVGNPSTDAEFMRASSPVNMAAKMKAPLLIISGQADTRTPLEQAEKMREALRKVGKEPEWLVKAEEGHGFAKVENRLDTYNTMLKFLDKHTGTTR